MAKVKKELIQTYINDELATAQQDKTYAEGDKNMPAEQYNSPEAMHKQPFDHVGNKTRTKGYKG